jgi:hypothetical protein
MAHPVSQLLGGGGTELNNSRRWVDVSDCQYARSQYSASDSISVRIEYYFEVDDVWNTLVLEENAFGTDVICSTWQEIPPEAKVGDLLIRCLAIGGGLLTSVNYVELQYR